MGTIALILLLLLSTTSCTSRSTPGCMSPAQLVSRFERLRALNWRTVSATDLNWPVSPVNDAAAANEILSHVGIRDDDYCLCCETLTFADRRQTALRSVGIIHEFDNRRDALGLARALARAALGPHATGVHLTGVETEGEITESLGSSGTETDTILDVRVFRRGSQWLTNVFWGRYYHQDQE